MPVTAKLSRNFYDRLGDEIAGELVDWFNSVDTTYQAQLREMNDLNWERFKAELHSQGAELRAEMQGMRAELRAEMKTLVAELRSEMKTQIAELRSDLMKWMFIYWTGTMATQAAFLWAILQR